MSHRITQKGTEEKNLSVSFCIILRLSVGYFSMPYKNPERAAWLVILGAFAVFLVVCATVPLGMRYYLHHATAPQTASLEVIDGTVRVRVPGGAAPIAVTQSMQLEEGTAIETDETSRGILTFHDGSTTILFPGTQITLREMRVSTFPWGVEPITIVIDQTRGTLRVGAAAQLPKGNEPAPQRQLQVNTPQLTTTLDEGSYRIVVDADQSQVTVTNGNAAVAAQGRTVQVGRGQRTVVRPNEPPLAPLPAAQDIIVNGDFADPLPRGWDDLRDPSNSPGTVPGSAKEATLGDRQTLHIVRTGSNQVSAITGVIQQFNKEVSDYRTMTLATDVRLHAQSLSGGGILSSEYPLILRIKYRDVYGSEAEWVHGFYYQNLTNNPTINGEQVPLDVWIPFESGNLLETLNPRPFFITSLQIYASGWDYDADVTGIRLIVE